MKVLSALCEQKLVYQNPAKKQNYLHNSGAVKYANACIPIQTCVYLTAPVKKLNCLNDVLCFFYL